MTPDFINQNPKNHEGHYQPDITEGVRHPRHIEQHHIPGQGTWYKVLGFRHIHGEMNYAYRYKANPPPVKYLDPRYTSSNDLRAAEEFEKGNLEFVKEWWAKE